MYKIFFPISVLLFMIFFLQNSCRAMEDNNECAKIRRSVKSIELWLESHRAQNISNKNFTNIPHTHTWDIEYSKGMYANCLNPYKPTLTKLTTIEAQALSQALPKRSYTSKASIRIPETGGTLRFFIKKNDEKDPIIIIQPYPLFKSYRKLK